MSVIAEVLIVLVLLVGSYTSGNYFGRAHGVASQKAEDQLKFDAVSQKLTEQTADANAKLLILNANIITSQAAADQFKTNLEKERAINRNTVDGLRAKCANDSLRYAASQDAGRGVGSGGAGATKDIAPSASAPTILQLPDSITAALRQLTADADSLATDYQTCYRYVNR